MTGQRTVAYNIKKQIESKNKYIIYIAAVYFRVKMLMTKRYCGKKSNVETNIFFEEYMRSVSKGI